MNDPDADIELLERTLAPWFPATAFVKFARIARYPILPEEESLVADAVERRQAEFATGRWLARTGLRHFGIPDAPIRMGRLRNPVWPESALGTISHDGGLCGVVLVPKGGSDDAGIGIDLVSLPQRTGRMDELAPMFVAGPEELAAMRAFEVDVEAALLLFSLKEAVVKALSSRLEDFIDLRAIEIHPDRGAPVTVSGEPVRATLRAAVAGGHLVTAARIR